MKTLANMLLIAALSLGVPVLDGHDRQPPKVEREKVDPGKVKELMHKKLDHAQKILAAIALNDPDRIATNADALIQVSKEAEWRIFKTPQYEMNSDDFRRSAEKLVRQARAKDLESAKLTYLEMTMTCFHCHRYVRDVGMIRFEAEVGSR